MKRVHLFELAMQKLKLDRYIFLLAAFGAYLAHVGVSAEKQEARRPNIVFIFSDDHAVQSIGAYGSAINKTPNIDRLAMRGMVFENAFCANSVYRISSHEGFRDSRYKLINFYELDGFNLFDLKRDPMELRDVSRDPAYRKVFKAMKGKLVSLKEQYKVSSP